MADALNALEKLADAADALETGSGSVHERLFEAFTYLVRIGPEDVPEGELRLAFAELMGREATGFSSDIDAETRIIALLMRAVHFMGFCYPLRYPIGINRN